jgi:hypothetical protein
MDRQATNSHDKKKCEPTYSNHIQSEIRNEFQPEEVKKTITSQPPSPRDRSVAYRAQRRQKQSVNPRPLDFDVDVSRAVSPIQTSVNTLGILGNKSRIVNGDSSKRCYNIITGNYLN